MTFRQLLALLVAAKIAGIAGVVAMFSQHRTLAGACFLMDAVLLVISISGAYNSMIHQFAQPYDDTNNENLQ